MGAEISQHPKQIRGNDGVVTKAQVGYINNSPTSPGSNHLYYGDNLDILRNDIASASVDLVYLDPPFNSQANYNILFKAHSGEQSQAQIEAFEDTWHWNEHAETAFDKVMHSGNSDAAEMLRAMRAFLKENDLMAYLTMMAIRLIELHRTLKSTGSLYLHCDPTASHYLKNLMDAIFGVENFRNEIIWQRSTGKSLMTTRLPNNHDVIFRLPKDGRGLLGCVGDVLALRCRRFACNCGRKIHPEGR